MVFFALETVPVTPPDPSEALNVAYEVNVKDTLLDVTVHGPKTAERVLVNSLPWSEYVRRPDANDRFGQIAKAADSLVVSVDNPGVGAHGGTLTKEQREMLHEGNIAPIAEIQYEALQLVADKLHFDLAHAAMMGLSLGTIMTHHLARHIEPRKMVLIEPVGVTKTSPVRLASSFGYDGRRMSRYKSENPLWFQELPSQMAPQKRAHYDYFKAITNGGYFDDINQGIDTTLVRGTDSTVVSQKDVDTLASRLKNGEVWSLEGENHSMVDSVGRVAMLIQELKSHGRL